MASLATVPSDIMKHNVLGFLDYESRMNVNRALPFEERLVKRIPFKVRVAHDVIAHCSIIQNIIAKFETNKNRVVNLAVWREFCKKLLDHRTASMLRYSQVLRPLIVQKLVEFSDAQVIEQPEVPKWLAKRILHVSAQALTHIQELPPSHTILPKRFTVS